MKKNILLLSILFFTFFSLFAKPVSEEYAKKIPQLADFGEAKESTEICFVDTTYTDVLKDYINVDQKGEVLDSQGKIIGQHKGYIYL
jgi:tRNA-specific 2-thiouridylase